VLESAALDASRLTQQIALPRMARFSSLSATIMYCFPENRSGLPCVNARLLMIPDCVFEVGENDLELQAISSFARPTFPPGGRHL
jgi:hypothetical protein